MAPSLNPSTASSLRAYIDAATASSTPTLPAAVLQILDKDGKTLFSHGTSNRTPTTLFPIHSCSKLIGAIAFMQLVDRGLVSLDDASAIERHLPELAAAKVMTGSETGADGKKKYVFEDQKNKITPRMLLNHTNGTGSTFFNTELREYLDEGWDARNEGSDYYATLLASPLLWQPGTKTNYGQGFDWLSVLIERLTGRPLEDVLREQIFEKVGATTTGFRGEMCGSVVAGEGVDFWPTALRTEEGFVNVPGFAEKKVEREDAWPKGKHHSQSVATGLISSLADVARIFSILLPQNAGTVGTTAFRRALCHMLMWWNRIPSVALASSLPPAQQRWPNRSCQSTFKMIAAICRPRFRCSSLTMCRRSTLIPLEVLGSDARYKGLIGYCTTAGEGGAKALCGGLAYPTVRTG